MKGQQNEKPLGRDDAVEGGEADREEMQRKKSKHRWIQKKKYCEKFQVFHIKEVNPGLIKAYTV